MVGITFLFGFGECRNKRFFRFVSVVANTCFYGNCDCGIASCFAPSKIAGCISWFFGGVVVGVGYSLAIVNNFSVISLY